MASGLFSSLRGFLKRPDRAGEALAAGGTVLEALNAAWDWVHEVRATVNVVTWAEITQWFHSVEMPETAECGAVLRRETSEGVEVILVLVDANRALVSDATTRAPVGVRLRASRLDEEAIAAFNGKNLIILN